jgi:hypothetical protein
MKKLLLILLAIALALSVGLIGCGQQEEEEEEEPEKPLNDILVIGVPTDTLGPLAIFDMVAAGPVMREFVYQVNNVSDGVHLSYFDDGEPYYCGLEIDRREIGPDSLGNVGTVTDEIIADIKDGTVHYLFGGPGTDCIFIQAPKAEANDVVLLTFEGGATVIANDPTKLAEWPHVFITLSYSDWYQLPVLAATLEAELERTADAYVLHIEGEHGDEYLATAEDNFNVVGSAEIPFDPSLYAPLVDGVMDTAIAALSDPGYDIFCCFAYPDHVMMTTGTAMAKSFNPPAMIFGPGANFGFYAYSFGEPISPCMVNGIMSFTVAAYDAKAAITDVYDLIAARMDDDAGDPYSGIPEGPPGILSLDYWGIPCYWAGLEMWLQAVEVWILRIRQPGTAKSRPSWFRG